MSRRIAASRKFSVKEIARIFDVPERLVRCPDRRKHKLNRKLQPIAQFVGKILLRNLARAQRRQLRTLLYGTGSGIPLGIFYAPKIKPRRKSATRKGAKR